jgi:phospholipid/cholesterol/gamma-HCH transport system substrate-binding protein
METDKHYFVEGLFIIAFTAAIAFAFIWLSRGGDKDDVVYRIRFSESVSGMALGDAVRFRGLEVGQVTAMTIDPEDPRKIVVLVALRRDAPVHTDTRAILKWKGITGNVYIELDGAAPGTRKLAESTPPGQIPEIVSAKSGLTAALEQLPKIIEKFGAIEDKTNKLLIEGQKAMTDVNEITKKVKENPSLLLRRPSKPPAETDAGKIGSGS